MPELLFELGCEELPASSVRRAVADLCAAIEGGLREAEVAFGESKTLCTPRRLIVSIADVEGRQPDRQKESRGPALKAAYDADGNPTKALEGFCRGQGVSVESVRKDGDYVWITQQLVGKPTGELLTEILPNAVRSLSFDKVMRWGSYRMKFARPIRWVLACFDGQAVNFELESVRSGTQSRGHRFDAPEGFDAKTFDELVSGLLQRHVEPDPKERIEKIREAAYVGASGKPDLSESLLEENAFLTEWPQPVEGEFLPEYLELPEPVLVTVMAKHERFFPVRDDAGQLMNRFISVRNGGDPLVVRDGNAWVLNARFNDANFFYEEDKKSDLAAFLEKTRGIVFQEKLGTVRDRADRLSSLAVLIAERTGADASEIELAREAALLAKADQSTGLVSELPELQGRIGAVYAQRAGKAPAVVAAIQRQYDPIWSAGSIEDRTALRVLLADQLDKLAGFLGIGLIPTGSSDPYGLRRASTFVIDTMRCWNVRWQILPLFRAALEQYQRAGIAVDEKKATEALQDLFVGRYNQVLGDVRHDLREAAVLADDLEASLDVRGVFMRSKCMEALAGDTAFVQAATRPLNIVEAARKKAVGFADADPLTTLNASALESVEGQALFEVMREIEQPLFEARGKEDHSAVVELLKRLQKPIDAFFDSTMVMVEDERVRYARLTLLSACCEQLRVAGDFRKVV